MTWYFITTRYKMRFVSVYFKKRALLRVYAHVHTILPRAHSCNCYISLIIWFSINILVVLFSRGKVITYKLNLGRY